MPSANAIERPELRTDGGNLRFILPGARVFPEGHRGPSPVLNSLRFVIPLALATPLLLIAFLHLRWALIPLEIAGMVGMMLLILGLAQIPFVLGRLRAYARAAETTPTSVQVQAGELIRVLASGREQRWRADAISDVAVKTHTHIQYGGDYDQDVVIKKKVLCVLFLDGDREWLCGFANADSPEEKDLQWMAAELRRALGVPGDGFSAVQIRGASMKRTTDGLIIRLPCSDPAIPWRNQIRGHFIGMVFFLGIMILLTVVFFVATNQGFALEWGFLAILIPFGLFEIILAILILFDILGRDAMIAECADRTTAALEVKSGALTYHAHSGKTYVWPAETIASLSVDEVQNAHQVRVHFKSGQIAFLFGLVYRGYNLESAYDGLHWLAHTLSEELSRGPPPRSAVTTENLGSNQERDR